MAFKRLNDLQLKEEYCVKPNTEKCPTLYCYDNEFQCRYWKQVWGKYGWASHPTRKSLV